MGNILFVVGIGLVLGHQKTLSFFARKEKFKGTVCFLLGIGLILARYPLIGFVIELYGILCLFGDFFGVIVGFIGAVPVVSVSLRRRGEEGVGWVLTGGIDRSVCGGSVEEDYRCYTTATCLGSRIAHYMISCDLDCFALLVERWSAGAVYYYQ